MCSGPETDTELVQISPKNETEVHSPHLMRATGILYDKLFLHDGNLALKQQQSAPCLNAQNPKLHHEQSIIVLLH